MAVAGGKLHAAGGPEDVLTEATVRAVFGMENRVIADPPSGKPMLPLGRRHVLVEPAASRTPGWPER